MTPEQEVLSDLLAQVNASIAALDDTLALVEPFPATLDAYEARSVIQRISGTALLKQIEQAEDGLARAFRAVLRMLGQSLKGLYPYDIAAHMIELDVLDTPEPWVELVKLRNELVHEYSLPSVSRLRRLIRAYDAVPFLRHRGASRYRRPGQKAAFR